MKCFYLDAKDNVLIKRYKETRRSHPLSGTGRVDQGIAEERTVTCAIAEAGGLYFGYQPHC